MINRLASVVGIFGLFNKRIQDDDIAYRNRIQNMKSDQYDAMLGTYLFIRIDSGCEDDTRSRYDRDKINLCHLLCSYAITDEDIDFNSSFHQKY